MWVQCIPDEIEQWKKHAAAQAQSDGLVIGFGLWVLVSILFSSGWFIFFRLGVATYQSASGSFWRSWVFERVGLS
jgi:hypothetical protein